MARRLIAALLALAAAFAAGSARAADQIDLALVLAIDSSTSITTQEFAMQRQGLARALSDPSIRAAIAAGRQGRIAIAVMDWSGMRQQLVAVPWTLVDPDSVGAFAQALLRAPRGLTYGGTAIAPALARATRLLHDVPLRPARRVIDVSGDGERTAGPKPREARDAAIAAGITINGLAILHEEPALLAYYEREVIGGERAFALPVANGGDFADAMRQKLVREILGDQMADRRLAPLLAPRRDWTLAPRRPGARPASWPRALGPASAAWPGAGGRL
ncbi:DUF1194 domain-containing protein [Zavarzinia sp. CC-PAN008]|uniref:DUF1194 domain-containing protein n=1 Tax=Zavarzinia sp. CC-PAN008 TaxID=3243332 RepID=UPI003F74829A